MQTRGLKPGMTLILDELKAGTHVHSNSVWLNLLACTSAYLTLSVLTLGLFSLVIASVTCRYSKAYF